MDTSNCFDVVVVGSGAAGLSAALVASVSGARVLVLEKASVIGGTTAMSGGCIWVPNHHHQAALSVADSQEAALDYIRAVSPEGWHNQEESLWVAFVTNARKMLKFVEEHSPTRFIPNREPDPYAEENGGLAFGRNVSAAPLRPSILKSWRHRIRQPAIKVDLNYEEIFDNPFIANPKKWGLVYAPKLLWRKFTGLRTRGNALVIGLFKGCLDAGVEVWSEAKVKSLTMDADRINGVIVECQGKDMEVAVSSGVILASGGFEWNKEMMARYFPGPVEWTASPRTNTGDGQRMAFEVGAHLDRMDQALIMGTSPVYYDDEIQGLPASDYFLPHAIIVNKLGKRFVNEKQMNIGLAFAERDQKTRKPINLPAWRIYDAQYAAKYPHMLPKAQIPNNRFQAETLEELAKIINVKATGLVSTVARFNSFVRAGKDEDFGRGDGIWDTKRGGDPSNMPNPTLGTLERPPFMAMPFHASFLGTKGGPRTNERAQVLRPNGKPIEGLYAAGNVMANSFGSKGVGAGTTLGPCLTWGYIAGCDASKHFISGRLTK
ncbi:MAG: dehydrogenase [Magnetovibrio sp.]|nr:dehydrogenase [Magnetovibrio sp.]